MTDPIGFNFPRHPHVADGDAREPDPSQPSAVRAHDPVPWGLAMCRRADTVLEGYLCDEPTVVSDACRKPKNRFDAFVCDEPRMKSLQARILTETVSILKAIFLSLIMPKAPR